MFSEQALSFLTDDRKVSNDFVGFHFDNMSGTLRRAHLVILPKDFSVVVFDASDESVSEGILGLFKTTDDMCGWCKFDDLGLVDELATKLHALDVSQPLPPFSSIVGGVQKKVFQSVLVLSMRSL